MIDRLRAFLAAAWLALTGLTIAQINAYLGFVSLCIGVSYQLWRWRRESKQKPKE